MSARYPDYGPEVNAVLDVARAARQLESVISDAAASNIIQTLEKPAQAWWWDLIDIVLDHEEAGAE